MTGLLKSLRILDMLLLNMENVNLVSETDRKLSGLCGWLSYDKDNRDLFISPRVMNLLL